MYNVIVIKCHQYTFWLNYNDLTVLPHWNDGVYGSDLWRLDDGEKPPCWYLGVYHKMFIIELASGLSYINEY